MTSALCILLLVLVPLSVITRVKRCLRAAVFNPFFYLVIFSYFYLLVPSVLAPVVAVTDFLGVGEETFDRVNLFSAWYVLVFSIFYYFTNDYSLEVRRGYVVPWVSVRFSFFVCAAGFLLAIYVLAKHGLSLYAVSGDRAASYEYYKENILQVYGFNVVFLMSAVSAAVLVFWSRNFKYFFTMLPFALVDTLQGGRGNTFVILFFVFFTFAALRPTHLKRAATLALLFVMAIFVSAFVRRASADFAMGAIQDVLVELFGEFYYTRLTAEYVYAYKLGVGGAGAFVALFLSKFFPQFLVSLFFDLPSVARYDVLLNDETGLGFGLAGSVLAEAFYYGGEVLAIVSPIVVSVFFLALHQLKVVRTLPGFVFLLLLIGSFYSLFRSAFFTGIASLVYMHFVYFSFVVYPAWGLKLFKVDRR